MADFGQLLGGYRVFKATTYLEQKDMVRHLLMQGASPKTMFIACADMRVSPDAIFSSNPGDFFISRNIGGLVPPYRHEGARGTIAAIEHAVVNLNVDNIVVLGHANCDSIKLLMRENDNNPPAVQDWLSIADDAKEAVLRDLSDKTPEEQEDACERETILVSLKNLLTYPFIEERVKNDSLKIYGWHFDIDKGMLVGFDPSTKFFETID